VKSTVTCTSSNVFPLSCFQQSPPYGEVTGSVICTVYTVELGYNDFGLCVTSAIALHMLLYRLIPHKARVFLPCLVRHNSIYLGYNDTPIIRSNIIFKETDYFENSAVFSSTNRQAPQSFRQLYQLHILKITTVVAPANDVRSIILLLLVTRD
jgi:hypothetical protein